MTESIEDLLVKGYGIWRRNPVLGVPPLLSFLAVALISIAAVLLVGVTVFMTFMSQMTSNGFDPSSLTPLFTPVILFLLVTVFLAVFLLASLVSSFFSAGAIGMAVKAVETGKTNIDDMVFYGKKKFLSLFFAKLLILLLTVIGSLVFIPAVVVLLSGLLNAALSLSTLGLTVFILYATVLNIVLMLVPYAIVVGDLGATEGIEKGYGVFMKNKLSILFLLFVTMGLGMGCELIRNLLTSLMAIVPCIGPFINLGILFLYMLFLVLVIAPLSTVWWTRLYMDRTTGLRNESSPPETPPQNREPPSSQPEIYM